jgi:2-iminobutanoate/2-iminopropanoate deaminase
MSEILILPLLDATIPIAKAVVHNGMVYISGNVGFKPGTTAPISDEFRLQAREVFRSLEEALVESKSSINNLVMIRVYLANIRRDFAALNEEFARWVGDHRPARTTVEAKLAVEGLLIEADCIGAVEST